MIIYMLNAELGSTVNVNLKPLNKYADLVNNLIIVLCVLLFVDVFFVKNQICREIRCSKVVIC